MKKILLSCLAFTLVVAVKAQEIPDRKTDRKDGMMHRMHDRANHHQKAMAMKGVEFTDQQKELLKKGNADFRSRFEALKKEDNITVKEYRTRMENLHKEHKTFLQSVLTADQKAQIEKNKADMKSRQQEMGKKRAEMMKTRLGLTDQQAAQMKKNHEELSAKLKSIREDKSLTEEKKREAIRNELKAQKDRMNSILTEEQKAKMKEMRNRKGGERHERKGDWKQGDKKEDKKEVI